MFRIGYVWLRDADLLGGDRCAESHGLPCGPRRGTGRPWRDNSVVLDTILDFVGEGDELVVSRLDQLAGTCRGRLEVIDRLERRGASSAS